MQNAKCRVQNYGVRFADRSKTAPKGIPRLPKNRSLRTIPQNGSAIPRLSGVLWSLFPSVWGVRTDPGMTRTFLHAVPPFCILHFAFCIRHSAACPHCFYYITGNGPLQEKPKKGLPPPWHQPFARLFRVLPTGRPSFCHYGRISPMTPSL